MLYTAKGIGALFVPIGNLMMEATGTWSTVLYTVATMDPTAAFLAIVVLRPVLASRGDVREACSPRSRRRAARPSGA